MKRMKGRLLTALLSIAMLFTMIPMMAQEAYAKGDSPSIVKSGDLYSFVKDAPITTVRIDGSKLKKDYAELTYQMNAKYSNNKFEWGETSVGNRDCVVINDLTTEDTSAGDDGVMLPGSFTLTYKNAAIMRDGTTKDLKVTYAPEIRMKKDTASYTDSFTIMAFQSRKPGITIQPLTKEHKHFGLIVNVACQVVGADNNDTFLIVSDEINTARTTYDFQQIVYAGSNNNYGEAINLVGGVNGESDVYLPGESTLSTSPSDITGKNGYQVRFLATDADMANLNHVAAVASASGIQAKIWSSGGDTDYPLDLYYLDATKDVFTKEHTSSSGEGGKIELWTDGLTHNSSVEARKLAGGTIATPYTYAVPYGKEVTYRMIPEKCYDIDKLYVNGSEVDLAEDPNFLTVDSASGGANYYEYAFGEDAVNEDQDIKVTWKLQHDFAEVKRVEPSCTKDGSEAYWKCKNCGTMYSDADGYHEIAEVSVIPALDHNYGEWTKLDDDQHYRECERDKTHVEKANHTWDAGVVTKPATTTATGVKTYTCTACKATKTETIAKLPKQKDPEDPKKDDPEKQYGTDGTPVGPGASIEAAEKAITKTTSDKDIKGAKFAPLKLRSTSQGKTNIKLTWTKNKNAVKYVVYGNRCNASGKKYKPVKLATVSGKACNIKKIKTAKVKKGTYYKFVIVALNKNNKVVSTSKTIHVATKGGKVGNHKSVTVKAKVNAKGKAIKKAKPISKTVLKKGKSLKLIVKLNPAAKKLKVKKHVGLRYETTNAKVATVSGSKIKANGKGTCYIFAYAQNGVAKSIKVTVK